MKIDILKTRVSKWGEGPVWWQNHLYFVDIQGYAIVRFDPETGEEKVWDTGQRVGFAQPCEDGRWIWGGDDGLFFINLDDGVSTRILDPESGIPDNRFNDAAVSPDGRLFAGTISMPKVIGNAALYRLEADLSCHLAFPNVTNSNGTDWSPDGKICYYIDTPSYNVRSFGYNSENGALTNEKIIFNTEKMIDGVPDGMCSDTEGNLWIAFCHGGCVVKFTPSGKQLDRIDFPCVETTSCCFGGPDLKDLYVTTGISPKVKEEHAGKVFVVRNAGKGNPQVAIRVAGTGN